jgi:carotenoid cleavage dioxygenase
LKIKNGKATYMARFVRTSKLQQEEYYGAAKFLKASQVIRTLLHMFVNSPRTG